jgi:colanic acid/amylovoran biosynthesis glycosyltransferase
LPINPIKIIKSLNFFKYGKKALSLYLLFHAIPFLNKGPYEIIHCHFGPRGITGALLKSAGILNGKLITTFHAYDLTSYLEKKGENIYNQLFEIGDIFQPVSYYWKNKLLQLGCDEKKICVHRMGVVLPKFNFSLERHQKGSKIRFLSIARFVEKKGIHYGIRAFAQILEKYPNIEYFIIGDGPLKCELQNLIESLNIKQNVHILGWMNQNEVSNIMDKSKIFLAPSITDKNGEKEGIPVVLMEAMAKGLPVISTYHSGIPELIIHDKTGLLVKEKDEDGLAKKMEYLIENPDSVKRLVIEARKMIEKSYNIETLNEELLKIYEKLYR